MTLSEFCPSTVPMFNLHTYFSAPLHQSAVRGGGGGGVAVQSPLGEAAALMGRRFSDASGGKTMADGALQTPIAQARRRRSGVEMGRGEVDPPALDHLGPRLQFVHEVRLTAPRPRLRGRRAVAVRVAPEARPRHRALAAPGPEEGRAAGGDAEALHDLGTAHRMVGVGHDEGLPDVVGDEDGREVLHDPHGREVLPVGVQPRHDVHLDAVGFRQYVLWAGGSGVVCGKGGKGPCLCMCVLQSQHAVHMVPIQRSIENT